MRPIDWSATAPTARNATRNGHSAVSNCCGRSTRTRAPELDIPQPGLPEDGHESRTWQAGIGTRGDQAFGEYGLRMAYHDLNDNAESFPLGAQIEILQMKLRQYEGNHWQVAATGPGDDSLPDPAQRVAATAVVAGHRWPGAGAGQA